MTYRGWEHVTEADKQTYPCGCAETHGLHGHIWPCPDHALACRLCGCAADQHDLHGCFADDHACSIAFVDGEWMR